MPRRVLKSRTLRTEVSRLSLSSPHSLKTLLRPNSPGNLSSRSLTRPSASKNLPSVSNRILHSASRASISSRALALISVSKILRSVSRARMFRSLRRREAALSSRDLHRRIPSRILVLSLSRAHSHSRALVVRLSRIGRLKRRVLRASSSLAGLRVRPLSLGRISPGSSSSASPVSRISLSRSSPHSLSRVSSRSLTRPSVSKNLPSASSRILPSASSRILNSASRTSTSDRALSSVKVLHSRTRDPSSRA